MFECQLDFNFFYYSTMRKCFVPDANSTHTEDMICMQKYWIIIILIIFQISKQYNSKVVVSCDRREPQNEQNYIFSGQEAILNFLTVRNLN